MTDYDWMKESMMELITRAEGQRLSYARARRLGRKQARLTTFEINEVLNDLLEEGELVYRCQGSEIHLEIPCNGCGGKGHHAARPMRFATDDHGNQWLCDDTAVLSRDAGRATCWDYGRLAFTRAD